MPACEKKKNMSKQRIEYLMQQYLGDVATESELHELAGLMKDQSTEGAISEVIETSFATQSQPQWNELRLNEMIENVLKTDQVGPAIKGERKDRETVKVREIFSWTRVAAASILILVSIGTYFYFNKHSENHIAQNIPINIEVKDVEAPKNSKATITLSNGQSILLDSMVNGTLAVLGNVKVIKNASGDIIYNGSAKEVAYNTLSNPRGSTVINLTLQDGTKVWLNAESSLKYPMAFVGDERRVEITGEAYFQVAHNKAKPFIVQKNDVSVKVLGTNFNVNTYEDEVQLKVTLLEGSVQVISRESSILIKPGEQAQLANTSAGRTGIKVQTVDVNEVIAWQRGIFELNNTELPAIMRQISRWYDLDIVYEGKPGNEKFGGGISKNVPLSSMLKLLEANGTKFTLEGKILKVRP